jgi:hypothetical protein
MLDLPLRGEDRPKDLPLEPPAEPARDPRPPADPPPPRVRPADRRRSGQRPRKRRWPLFLLLLSILVAAVFAFYRLTTPVAGFSMPSLELGEQLVGGVSDPVEVMVTNEGSRAMALTGVRFTGEAAAEFQVLKDDCSGSTRQTGEACTLAVAFRPAANGPRTASLDLTGNVIGSLPVSGIGAAPVLTVERSEIDFGPQPVDGRSASRTVDLRNDGAATLSVATVAIGGAHAQDFAVDQACAGLDLEPGKSCAARVSFTPRAAGERSATLSIAGDRSGLESTVALNGAGVWNGEALDAVPAEIDFGEQRRGRASAPARVAFINRTSEPIAVGEVRLEAGSSGIEIDRQDCRQTTLAPGDECGVELKFTPADVGDAAAALTVATADGLVSKAALKGTGVEPRIAVEKSALEFGELRVGFERQRQAVLTNSGSATLAFREAALAGSASSSYRRVKDGCSGFTLAPGRTCSIELAFKPLRSGALTAELRIESDAAGGRETIALRGEGTMAELTVDQQRLDFGTVRRPGSADQALTLSNDGSARLRIQGVTVTGGAAADFVVAAIGCGESGLDAGGSCRISVRFVPRADGARAATLVIRHDGDGPAKEVALLGTALAAQPGFRASNGSIDFGSRQVGSRSPVETLTITNTGDGPLELTSIALGGANADEFTLVPGTCDGAPFVAPHGNCTIGIRFTPRANGSRRATVRIRHNAGGESSVELSGAGSGG